MQARPTTLPAPSACRVRNARPSAAEITGRPLAFLVITEEQLRAGLTQASLPPQVVNTVISIQTSFAEGAFDILTGDVERLGGGRLSLWPMCLPRH